MASENKAGSHFGDEARFFSKLGWTIAFALKNGDNRWIIGIDDLGVRQWLALGESTRLPLDAFILACRLLELPMESVFLRRGNGGIFI
jgi:hypothetical protein